LHRTPRKTVHADKLTQRRSTRFSNGTEIHCTDIRRGAAGVDRGRKLTGSNSYIKTAQRRSRVFVTVTTSPSAETVRRLPSAETVRRLPSGETVRRLPSAETVRGLRPVEGRQANRQLLSFQTVSCCPFSVLVMWCLYVWRPVLPI